MFFVPSTNNYEFNFHGGKCLILLTEPFLKNILFKFEKLHYLNGSIMICFNKIFRFHGE